MYCLNSVAVMNLYMNVLQIGAWSVQFAHECRTTSIPTENVAFLATSSEHKGFEEVCKEMVLF